MVKAPMAKQACKTPPRNIKAGRVEKAKPKAKPEVKTAWITIHRIQFIKYYAKNKIHRIQCIEYDAYATMDRIYCIEYNTYIITIRFALNTAHRKQCIFLVYRTQYTEYNTIHSIHCIERKILEYIIDYNVKNTMHWIYSNIGQISIAAMSQSCDFFYWNPNIMVT